MSYPVVPTPTFQEIYLNQLDYLIETAKSPQAADKLRNDIKRAIEQLSDFPESGSNPKPGGDDIHDAQYLYMDDYTLTYVFRKNTVYLASVRYGPPKNTYENEFEKDIENYEEVSLPNPS